MIELGSSSSDSMDVSGGMGAKVDHLLEIAEQSRLCVVGSGLKAGVVDALMAGRADVVCTRVTV